MLRFVTRFQLRAKARLWGGLGISATVFLLAIILFNLFASAGAVKAQTASDQTTPVSETVTPGEQQGSTTTVVTTSEAATTAAITTQEATTTVAPVTTQAAATTQEATTTVAPVTTQAEAATTAAPVTTQAAETTAAPVTTQGSVVPAQTAQSSDTPSGQPNTDQNDMDITADLSSDQVNQLKGLAAGQLSPQVVDQLKKAASDQIDQFGPILIDKLNQKAIEKQEQRLFWVAIILIGILPLATLLLFLLYPLVRRKQFKQRVPDVKLGKIYGMYIPQALLVTLVMLLLGSALWGIQLLTGRVLGGVTNPQLVLQREAINYVISDRETLLNNYTDIFVGFADDIKNEDPEKSVFDIVLENALQIKENPVVNTAVHIVQFVMPFLSYISLITLGLLVLFFLVRIRPEIASLLQYPIEILAAERYKTPLPPFRSQALNEVTVEQPKADSMRKIGQKLMWVELRVVFLFALAVLAVAIVMSFVLSLFFYPIDFLLIGSIGDAIEYFLRVEGAANTLLITVIILMLFLIETVAIFLLSFTFLLGKLQDALRQRMAGRITWKQTGQYMGRQTLRFGWILVLTAGFGVGFPYLADKINDVLYNGDKDPNWTVALLVVPVALLVLLNLGMWLLRGFRMFGKLLRSSAAVEFKLQPAKPKKGTQLQA